jgi:hypothetical protein
VTEEKQNYIFDAKKEGFSSENAKTLCVIDCWECTGVGYGIEGK